MWVYIYLEILYAGIKWAFVGFYVVMVKLVIVKVYIGCDMVER